MLWCLTDSGRSLAAEQWDSLSPLDKSHFLGSSCDLHGPNKDIQPFLTWTFGTRAWLPHTNTVHECTFWHQRGPTDRTVTRFPPCTIFFFFFFKHKVQIATAWKSVTKQKPLTASSWNLFVPRRVIIMKPVWHQGGFAVTAGVLCRQVLSNIPLH